MKYKLSKTVTEEINVDLPCFVKLGENHFWKILDELTVIIVTTYDFNTSIEIGLIAHNNVFGNPGWEFTTEDEYVKAEKEAMQYIGQYINSPAIV